MQANSHSCCFTGHRDIPEDERASIQKRLEAEVINLILQGVTDFYAGGALGFDTMAALTVLDLKRDFPQIRLNLALPCKEQTKGWTDTDTKIYDRILQRADTVVYVSEVYSMGCMHKRNRYLADHSGVCICYLKKSTGGTAYSVGYAKQKGLTVINIADGR